MTSIMESRRWPRGGGDRERRWKAAARTHRSFLNAFLRLSKNEKMKGKKEGESFRNPLSHFLFDFAFEAARALPLSGPAPFASATAAAWARR